MRMNNSKMWRSVMALLMVLCTVAGLLPASALAVDDSVSYVALGDSMTSGYGLKDGEKPYPANIAANCGWELNQQAVSGMSAAELNAMLAEGSDAAVMRASVTGADMISLGMGNTDFGTILPENAVNAANGNVYDYDLKAASASCSSEIQTLLTALRDQLNTIVGEFTKNTDVRDAVVNTVMNYMVNYAGAVDSIVKLNPDAEIILLGVLNPLSGKDASAESETVGFSLVEMLDEVVPYVNAYVAGIPAVLQLMGDEAYAGSVFYYADAEGVELMTCGCPSKSGHEKLAVAAIYAYEHAYTATQELMVSKDEILTGMVNSETNMGTHGEIYLDDESYYVAIGDTTVLSESYVDLLADELDVEFKNLAKDGMLVQNADSVVTANQADIEKADLITIGFSNVPFLVEAMGKFITQDKSKPDWYSIISEEEYVAIEGYLLMMEEKLEEYGVTNASTKDLMMATMEAYLFNCVAYAVKMPALIDQIHEINPDALVAIIGMYNPLDGVSMNLGLGSDLELGSLFDEMVDIMALYDIMYAMGHENTFYVYAPEVKTNLTKTQLNSLEVSRVFIFNKGRDLKPSKEGHAYICGQVMNVLTLLDEPKVTYMLGDVDHSGSVDFFDGMLALQYYAGVIGDGDLDVSLADVDEGGSVDFFDGMYILQYYAGVVDQLPVVG